MTSGRPRCSVEALAREEPLYATASLVSSWLLIEQPGAWGPDALTESGFPLEIASELEQRASGVRVLLIRNRAAPGDGRLFFKAHSGGEGLSPAMVSAPLPEPSALLEVDFQALAQGDPGPGTPIDHPTYLVCTHGRHDVCCSDRGRPFFRALFAARPERTWEVSHLGGDRFAANLLVLPRGDYFGRLEPDDVEPLASGYEAGQIDLAHYRGRSIHPRLVQAAEHFARESQGLTGLDDLALAEYRRSGGDRAHVVFEGPKGQIGVQVRAFHRPERPYLTCRAEQRGDAVGYELVSVTAE